MISIFLSKFSFKSSQCLLEHFKHSTILLVSPADSFSTALRRKPMTTNPRSNLSSLVSQTTNIKTIAATVIWEITEVD